MFSTFALAVPTVAQVETSISKGDYPTAKKQLEEVLAKQPDSLVANQYMMEIIKIEYAKSQVPSVEYKLYENRIATIKANIDKEKARIAKVAQDKRDAEYREGMKSFWTKILWVFIIAVPLGILYLGIREILQRRKDEKERQLQLQRVETWKSDTRAALLDLNRFITTKQEDNDDWCSRWPKLTYLQADTIAYLEDLRNNDYNGDDIDRHFENAENYFSEVGLT